MTPAARRQEEVRILAHPSSEQHRVLGPDALALVAHLTRAFSSRRDELLACRREAQARLDAGERLRFLAETEPVRSGDWTVDPLPADLQDRRVEITGPVDRKMIVNALNSGANVFMADFEDSTAPTWDNVVTGQANLMDAVRGAIDFTDAASGKRYALRAPVGAPGPDRIATLMVRPRGLHLPEAHVEVDGRSVPGAFFDFALYLFHNARALLALGTGPYFYLPKLESHLEARLWNDLFVEAQRMLGLPRGTIKATVLIETLPAAFEMDEILYELREHSAGLNCGRWDYIFSFIKKHRTSAAAIMPDRAQVTMEKHFLRSYTQLLVRTCHLRGVHAMGGMAAQIPIKNDEAKNRAALDKVRADKLREVRDGHDGTWVAHPALVPVARQVFDAHMPGPNQISNRREDVVVRAEDLLAVPAGPRTDEGLRHNLRVAVRYLEAWLRGVGCVPLYDLMEDAATAEISRAQVWQWIRHGATTDDGRPVTPQRVRRTLDEEIAALEASGLGGPRLADARALFEHLATSPTFEEFLTLPAYQMLIDSEKDGGLSAA